MRIMLSILSWFLLLSQLSLFDTVVMVSGKCLDDQRSLLLQLKQNLVINNVDTVFASYPKLKSWDANVDCCMWEGVVCDPHNTGYVIGLDLSHCGIRDGINGTSSLFKLHKLQRLNLAFNSMADVNWFPSEFGQLSNSLTHLNLSHTSFVRFQIPPEISLLTRLVSLDLSTFAVAMFPGVASNSESIGLSVLFQNLSSLRELHLDGISMLPYIVNGEWCQALSSTLPNLRVLSLSECNLQGPINSSLLQLRFLSHLDLSQNHLDSMIPDFFANFSYLASLNLGSCGLFGEFPQEIFRLPTLQKFDASYNQHLNVSLLEFPSDSALRVLDLSGTNFINGSLNSIGSLKLLTVLNLRECDFTEYFPSSIANLTRSLHSLDLSGSKFNGSIPSWIGDLTQLQTLDLSSSSLNGSIPSWIGKLAQLHSLGLSSSSLSGSISSWIGNLTQLHSLDLSKNNLNGPIPDSIGYLVQLVSLDLSSNNFSSLIPPSIGNLVQLVSLDLSANNFGDLIPTSIGNLIQLSYLDLSSNNLSGPIPSSICNLNRLDKIYLHHNELPGPIPSCMFTFPLLTTLRLNQNHLGGQLNEFENASSSILADIDLRNNKLQGQVPKSIFRLPSLKTLALSSNSFTGTIDLEVIKDLKYLLYLNLSSNMLHGPIPIPPPSIQYLDYSINNFTSTIPPNISSHLVNTNFFSLSGNNLHGEIPASICIAESLNLFDLSNNHFSGSIPQCLGEVNDKLIVLNLGGNNLTGSIYQNFSSECKLLTFDVNGNKLEGKVPISLANCKDLEVLNLGNNHLNGSFPFWLEMLSKLRVLILRGNNFHGSIKHPTANNSFPMLQIFDLSGNNFTGHLSPKWFQSLKAMKQKVKFDFLRIDHYGFFYKDTITVVAKGQEMFLEKILTVFTAIDLSKNKFEGDIPEVIGDLKSLYILNISHNRLTGQIPSALGELGNLESLDLSQNKLSGEIPQELNKLTFLSVLNLSSNRLVGKIPQGTQIQRQTKDSFRGNLGLCGYPLPTSCKEATPPQRSSIPDSKVSESTSEIDWEFAWIGFGCGGGIGLVGGTILGIVFYNRFLKKKGKRRVHRHIRQL